MADGRKRMKAKSTATTSAPRKRAKPASADLPPLSDVGDMFADMVSKQPQLAALGGRRLRVATMCSGTESPLLALDLISRAMKELHGASLEVEHVFSCEIEPFKQAYIERNFSPPVIFRDVCELGGAEATTVYGSKVSVPGNVDLLVAGTSCVDFSSLNNKKKTLDAHGQSGRTFRGMLDWVARTRPRIVVLENIRNAPWQTVVERFAEIRYSAQAVHLDTKNYYLPQTRERGYLVAVDEHASELPAQWAERVKAMERPTTATLDDFLLRSDDPRVVAATAKLVRDSGGRARVPADWGRCENRHQRTRAEEELGNRRPLTAWEAGGTCKLPDFANTPWGGLQVERVWDLMDILVLQFAYKGIDPSYKTLIWNLSQNVDRNVGSSRMGICPCLTPSMIPYATIRGGPMTGLEAISLQGLPVNNILFTRETEDNLYDLAGNAMSTTVVGSCMVAALTVAGRLLKAEESTGVTDVDMPEQPAGTRIAGEDHLVRRAVTLSASDVTGLPCLLDRAHHSRRLCMCEGRDGMTSRPLQECRSCGSTSCIVCGGRPEHDFKRIDLSELPRVPPGDFMSELKATLPMCITLSGVEDALAAVTDTGELVEAWQQALRDAASRDLRFADIQRQQVWTARFESPAARLELVLSSSHAEWSLFGKPKRDVPAGSPIRVMLEQPVARFRCADALFAGSWELAVPTRRTFTLQITGTGRLVDSWQRQLGLQREDVKEKKVWDTLEVSISEDAGLSDVDVAGAYKLHSKCGTACNSLHRRVGDGRPDMFLFLDPSRTGDAAQDRFVFSTTHRRLEYGEVRPVVASLDSAWRQNSLEGAQEVGCVVPTRWTLAPAFQHAPSLAQATVFVPPTAGAFEVSTTSCDTASAILVCHIAHSPSTESRGEWTVVDKVHERSTFQSLSWCLDRASRLCGSFDGWVDVPPSAGHECARCAPHPPTIEWRRVGKAMKGFEDPGQAGRYERALKQRPAAFVTQLQHESDKGGVGVVRISLNAMSLVHRAAASLPSTTGTTSFAYTLDTKFVPRSHLDPPNFSLKSNRNDLPHPQPPNFVRGRELRPEQLRSLTWMLDAEMAGQTFVEEEIAEAVLEPLGWRLQGRARHSHTVYGGVLADAVGYGKTAITLGLIDCRSSTTATAPLVQDVRGAIKVKTTLVIVPSHLTRQWSSEVIKFLGKKRYTHQVVSTVAQLNKLTIQAIGKLDILIVASSIFNSAVYLQNLQDFSAGGPLPKGDGRHVLQRLDEIASPRAEQVERIKANDLVGALAALRAAKQAAVERAAAETYETDASATPLTVADESMLTSDMDEDVPPPPRGRKRPSTSESADDVDDADFEDEKPAKKKAKTKSTAKRTPERMEQKLEAAAEKGDWRSLTAPLLEIFQFNRIVVDEYTYIDGKALHMITRLKSTYRWVLSGTPPVHDFAAVRSIATHLGIHLGIDDDGDYLSTTKKSQRTDVERFHAFREARTHEWHAHRQQVAQTFLDQCVRQNVAEIDEILSQEHIVHVQLPAAERAIYLELQHLLEGQDMVIRRRKKSESDREKRLAVVMGDSNSADEALLKRAATFDLDEVSTDSAMTVCERIVKARADQRDGCLSDLRTKMRTAHDMKKQLGDAPERYLKEFLASLRDKGFGDSDADAIARQCWDEAETTSSVEPQNTKSPKPKENDEATDADDDDDGGDGDGSEVDTATGAGGATDTAGSASKKAGEPTKSVEDLIWDLREHTHEMRRVMKELTGRVRSHRYFTAVRDVQRAGAGLSIACPKCGRESIGRAEAVIISSCGHMGCQRCVRECAGKEECVLALAADGRCRSVARTSSIVPADTLGVDDPAARGGKHFGRKLEMIVEHIKAIPADERILIFVQFPDLMKRVAAVLGASDIKAHEIKGSPLQKSKILDTFQNSADERVLLLDIMGESASGANLTCANHAIFVTPLLVPTQHIYDAYETQAVGRIRRYGQMNKVHVWRFLTLDTKDIKIYEDRTKQKVGRPDN